ncbi:unnamed protein product [Lathyrus sativus]|nr:unnamed protein product [Lathyrus sativus]
MLQLIRDADECEVVDLYVEHSISVPNIVDDAEVGHDITYNDDEVQCTGEKFVDDEVEVDNNAEVVDDVEVGEVDNDAEVGDGDSVEVDIDAEVGDSDGVEVDIDAEVGDGDGVEVDIDAEVGDGVDVDMDAEVGGGVDVDNDAKVGDGVDVHNDAEVGDGVDVHSDAKVGDGHDGNEPKFDSEKELESEPELDRATVIPTKPIKPHVNDNDFHHDNDEDSDQLQTPPESENDEEYERFPTYKVGVGTKFQLGMKFNNNDLVREAIKEYAMMEKKNVYLKKNDAKRMVVRCISECKFYMRIGKRVDNQYWQVAYRAKRRAMDIIQGAGRDQFTHLRTYANELVNSNPHSNIVLKCSDSSDDPISERIYICLEACKTGFAFYCRPLIGLDACFLKGD